MPGGGFAATAHDHAPWARLLHTEPAFEGDYLPSLLDAVPAPPLGPNTRYGLGVFVR